MSGLRTALRERRRTRRERVATEVATGDGWRESPRGSSPPTSTASDTGRRLALVAEISRAEPLVRMTEPPDDEHDADVSKFVLEAVRGLAEEQAARADRVRSSARQTFAYVSTLFTVAQAGAVAVMTRADTSMLSSKERVGLVALGLAAALALAVVGVATVWVDRLRSVRDPAPGDFAREADKALANDGFASDGVAAVYATVMRERKKAVDDRRKGLHWVTAGAYTAVLLVLAQIAVVLVSQLP